MPMMRRGFIPLLVPQEISGKLAGFLLLAIFGGNALYALDVSVRSAAICIIDQDGKVRLERSVPSNVPEAVT